MEPSVFPYLGEAMKHTIANDSLQYPFPVKKAGSKLNSLFTLGRRLHRAEAVAQADASRYARKMTFRFMSVMLCLMLSLFNLLIVAAGQHGPGIGF